MGARYYLETYDGHYCVSFTCSDYAEPRLITTYWPIGRKVNTGIMAAYDQLAGAVGHEITPIGERGFILPNGQTIALASTEPIGCAFTPIRPPSKARGWEWRCGGWHRGARHIYY